MPAPDWGGGYPVAESYLETAQPLQGPEAIDLALSVAGVSPPPRASGFRYAELGCGTGFTLAGLAALHPEGRFLGVDFMPEHVARARRLAAEAGLENLKFIEASFEDLAEAPRAHDPEPFDYIAMHGVWTWVSPENRARLVAILGRWLAPGGVLYTGYAAAAGWAETAAIRRIFREAPRPPGRPTFEAARAAVDAWLAAGGGDARTAEVWAKLSKLPDRYLAHDLGATHASAAWPAEVAEALAPAKLAFAAPADLIEQFDVLRFDADAVAFVRKAVAEGWGEAARDLMSRRGFRVDLFARGAPRLTEAEQAARLAALRIAPWPPRLAHERREAEVHGARPGFGPETAARVAAGFADGPATVAEFAERACLPPRQAAQAALLGIARREIAALSPPEAIAARAALPGLLAALRARFARGEPVPGAPSPITGRLVPLAPEEARALASGAPEEAEMREGLARLGLLDPAPQTG
ncbi:methyltransferase domain-containing protein [Albimonas sp. CAU 1670]|uniref:class I SAM-dependent methyltransferase n=1 Tax=Albimonas sp. CAU 1670 TaxID=3032599 RepID=UPI0023DC9486|nr:class I SAM-dependent methyltransferase [Albimonas sp. CAU 1670]MDF2235253.1 methyltransferase domain-containing protein [Albimonas sp. CAU 1670]